MWRATLKGMVARKLRLTLTALAVVIGVAFVSGTYVLTDTISRTFTDLFEQTTRGIDVAIRTKAAFNSNQGPALREPMPASLAGRVQAISGVARVEGSVTGYAQFIGNNGRNKDKPVTTGGAPTLGVSAGRDVTRSAVIMRAGQAPRGPTEVAVDALTAKKQGFKVGDTVRLLFQGPTQAFTVSGIFGIGQADNLAGATLAAFDLPTAQKVLNRQGVYDEIDVAAVRGVDPTTLRNRMRAALGPTYEVLTGKQLAADTAKSVGQFAKIIGYALLAFAFVALFVGSFIIVNTLSITLAQRTRELALLRALGASRGQVLGSVLAEAALTGAFASVVGLGTGIVFALGLNSVFKTIGVSLPATTLQIQPRTAVVGLAVGIGVTLIASMVPALRATRVPPVAALQEEAVATASTTGMRRTLIGSFVTLAGVALLLVGLFSKQGNRLLNVAGGAVVVFLGVGVLSPLVARPVAAALGWPFARWAGQPGKLARDNAMRNPRRTASTAAALMIGLALVTLVTIFAASLKSSVGKVLDQTVAADYILVPSGGQGFSTEAVRRIAALPQVEAAASVRMGVFKLDGKIQNVSGIDPVAYTRTIRTDTVSGRMEDLVSGGVDVRRDVAEQHGWKVGQAIAMEFPVGGPAQEPIRAIYKDNQLNGPYLLSLSDYQAHYADQLDMVALVKARANVSPDASRAAVEGVTNDFPNIQVKDQAEYKQQQSGQINRVLILFYVLLALAVVIAFIGIINTLALSILERVREIGLLRAVGMTRDQIRSMIRWEAVIIAVVGAAFGLAVGTFFGWTLVRALHSQGITEFVVPVGSLLAFVALAAVAGMLAAIFPSRRAAKIDMLRAIAAQ